MRTTISGKVLVQYPTNTLTRDVLIYVREDKSYEVSLSSIFDMVEVRVYSDVWRKNVGVFANIFYGVNGSTDGALLTQRGEGENMDRYIIEQGYTRIDHKFLSYIGEDRQAIGAILSSIQKNSIDLLLLDLYRLVTDLVCGDVAAEVVLITGRVLRVQLGELSNLFSFPLSRR